MGGSPTWSSANVPFSGQESRPVCGAPCTSVPAITHRHWSVRKGSLQGLKTVQSTCVVAFFANTAVGDAMAVAGSVFCCLAKRHE